LRVWIANLVADGHQISTSASRVRFNGCSGQIVEWLTTEQLLALDRPVKRTEFGVMLSTKGNEINEIIATSLPMDPFGKQSTQSTARIKAAAAAVTSASDHVAGEELVQRQRRHWLDQDGVRVQDHLLRLVAVSVFDATGRMGEPPQNQALTARLRSRPHRSK